MALLPVIIRKGEDMKRKMFLGIDIGGTHMRVGLVDSEGKILEQRKVATESHAGAEHASRRLIQECRAYMEKAVRDGSEVAAVGLGVAGKIDHVRGVVQFSPNLPEMNGFPLGAEVQKNLGIPVVVENDANVYGFGEYWVGKGRDVDSWVGLTMGTGVGGCLILGKRLWHGDGLGFVAEIGHMIVQPGGPLCNCGMRGCLEAHSSGSALMKGVEEAVSDGRLTEGPVYERRQAGVLDPEGIYECAVEGDPLAKHLFHRMGWALGLAISNIFTLLGIRHAIIGGGVSAGWSQFIDPLRQSLIQNNSMLHRDEMVVEHSQLGDDAAIWGAARMAMEAV
jgi:glucokinase